MTGQPIDLLERVAADVAARVNDQKPEGISVMVAISDREQPYLGWGTARGWETVAIEVARELGRRLHPDCRQTGNVLYFGKDEFGPGLHEVVLEVD